MQKMNRKDLFSVQNQVPGLASSLPGKYWQDNCLIQILSFWHCPLLLASICYFWRRWCTGRSIGTIDCMPAAAPSSQVPWTTRRGGQLGRLATAWGGSAGAADRPLQGGRVGAAGLGGISANARADAPAGGQERGRAGGRAGISKQAGVSHADVRKLWRAGIPQQQCRHCCCRPAHLRRLWALSSLLHRLLQAYWNLSMHFPDIIHLQFVHDFVSIVSSTSGFP